MTAVNHYMLSTETGNCLLKWFFLNISQPSVILFFHFFDSVLEAQKLLILIKSR